MKTFTHRQPEEIEIENKFRITYYTRPNHQNMWTVETPTAGSAYGGSGGSATTYWYYDTTTTSNGWR